MIMYEQQSPILNSRASWFEIKLFLGTAAAKDHEALNHTAGERRALLVFCRQLRGSEPDWARARAVAYEAGWGEIQFLNASTVDPASAELDETARASYQDAMARGSALIVYSDPV